MSVFGAATIKVNGKQYNTNKGAKLTLGGLKRTTKNHSKGRAGSQSEYEAGQVECSIPVTDGFSIDELRNIKGATVAFTTDTGQSYVVANADQVGSIATDDQSGDVNLTLEGDAAEEI